MHDIQQDVNCLKEPMVVRLVCSHVTCDQCCIFPFLVVLFSTATPAAHAVAGTEAALASMNQHMHMLRGSRACWFHWYCELQSLSDARLQSSLLHHLEASIGKSVIVNLFVGKSFRRLLSLRLI